MDDIRSGVSVQRSNRTVGIAENGKWDYAEFQGKLEALCLLYIGAGIVRLGAQLADLTANKPILPVKDVMMVREMKKVPQINNRH
jgi:hypothetical protein